MNKRVIWHLKSELKSLSYTWTLYPIIVLLTILALKWGYISEKSEVPAPIDWLITDGLLNLDKTIMLMVLVFPIGIIVWLLSKAYQFTRQERARLRSGYLFVVNQTNNVIRILSGALFGLWMLRYAPELGLDYGMVKLAESAYFVFFSAVFSILMRHSVDVVVVKK